jgi:hypothetical protein
MALARFNPTGSVEFDLTRGQVKLGGDGERLLVPVDALLALCQAAGDEAARDFGRRLGTEVGRRVAARLTEGVDRAPVEAVVEHLGGELALMGLGSLGVERWGRALVVMFEGSPLGAIGDGVLAAILEGAVSRAFSRDASVVVLSRDDSALRLLVTGSGGAERVRALLGQGVVWGEVLTRLHDAARGKS